MLRLFLSALRSLLHSRACLEAEKSRCGSRWQKTCSRGASRSSARATRDALVVPPLAVQAQPVETLTAPRPLLDHRLQRIDHVTVSRQPVARSPVPGGPRQPGKRFEP